VLVAVLLGGAVQADPGAGHAGTVRPQPVKLGRLGRRVPSFTDSIASPGGARAALADKSAFGGIYTTPSGAHVRVLLSSSFTPDPSTAQSYADFVDGLLHRSEINRVTIYVMRIAEIPNECGNRAVACYDSRSETIFTPGENPSDGSYTIEDVLTHEYGHHVANNRSDAPWSALVHGTKRWSSHLNVCHYERLGLLGGEYATDPGEGFAEAYRVTNGGLWQGLVVSLFDPNPATRKLVRRDVLHPWRHRTTTRYLESVRDQRSTGRTFKTPLDGRLRITARGPRRSGIGLYLRLHGRTVRRSIRPGAKQRLSYLICGQRRLRFALHGRRGGGRVRVRVTRP
jgi:hypothetical protein